MYCMLPKKKKIGSKISSLGLVFYNKYFHFVNYLGYNSTRRKATRLLLS